MSNEDVDRTQSLVADPPTPSGGTPRPALVLLWSADEPDRSGEVAWLEPGVDASFGRRGSLRFRRVRPSGEALQPDLGCPTLSREQLAVRSSVDGGFVLHNIGRATLRVDGRSVDELPWSAGQVFALDDRLLVLCERRAPLPPLAEGLFDPHPFGGVDRFGFVGETPEAWEVRRQVAFCGPLRAHVLVRGPSGSGKELVASAVHALSPRGRRPMVSRSAATIPETLVDAELFGNAANYPNPGMVARPGLIGAADGGTLFLDEIGELPEAQQVRLLRVLDDGEYTRLGEATPRRADLRLVAATNRPIEILKPDVAARMPLRIDTFGLDVHRADIPLVAAHLLRKIAHREPSLARFVDARGAPRWTAAFVADLVQRRYDTHVRELEAVLWDALRRARGAEIDAVERPTEDAGPPRSPTDPRTVGLEELKACLERHAGHKEAVWRELGLTSRYALARLMRKHGL